MAGTIIEAAARFVQGVSGARPALKFLTCGSVDDGKSTLIGRLLYEGNFVFDDQLATLERDSLRYGTTGDEMDFALLVDGLEAEREQGITIDVAYRYFATRERSFIVADCPGHEQYTRNMVTGASNADLAVLLVDARKGLLTQTRRHAIVVALLGVRHVVLAVNKMDLVGYDRRVFERIVADFEQVDAAKSFRSIRPIPISARLGDNISSSSANMRWYEGPTLISYLGGIDVEDTAADQPMRFPIQWVNRPDADFRGFAGTLASGRLQVGDDIVVAASGRKTRVARIVTMDGDVEAAHALDSITVVFEDEIDGSRGDILCRPSERPAIVDQFAANVIWMSDEELLPGRSYFLKICGRTAPAAITGIEHRLDIETQGKPAAKTLKLNEIGFCNLALSVPVALDAYETNRTTGSFILIDRLSNATVAAGMIALPLRRAANVYHRDFAVGKAARAALKHQKPAILWFTGLSGAGKSTIANLVEKKLFERHAHTILLHGDDVRSGINRDLGFTEADRAENVRRVAEVAKLMLEAGLIVLCSLISPFAAGRRLVRELAAEGEFIEIFIDAPLDVCIARDPKGLYGRALSGEIANFTGVSQPYERPENPELRFSSANRSAEEISDRIIEYLVERSIIQV